MAKIYAPPIYDNGGSLLAWATDEELTATKLRYQFDKAKPFRSRHAQQIKLIDEPVLPVRDLDALYQEIIQAISPILALLSGKTSICDSPVPKIPSALPESRHGVIKWPI